ncbi:MAG: hypothetical protein ACFE68_02300 [Candidatus Hodarchaeota archaeon]
MQENDITDFESGLLLYKDLLSRLFNALYSEEDGRFFNTYIQCVDKLDRMLDTLHTIENIIVLKKSTLRTFKALFGGLEREQKSTRSVDDFRRVLKMFVMPLTVHLVRGTEDSAKGIAKLEKTIRHQLNSIMSYLLETGAKDGQFISLTESEELTVEGRLVNDLEELLTLLYLGDLKQFNERAEKLEHSIKAIELTK